MVDTHMDVGWPVPEGCGGRKSFRLVAAPASRIDWRSAQSIGADARPGRLPLPRNRPAPLADTEASTNRALSQSQRFVLRSALAADDCFQQTGHPDHA